MRCNSHRLAYWVLRDYFERPLGTGHQVGLREARACKAIELTELMYSDRIPRLSVRAFILAIFALLYFRIEKLKPIGVVDDRQLRQVDINALIPVVGPRVGQIWSAGIFIPVIPGMPLNPFRVHKIGDSIPFLHRNSGSPWAGPRPAASDFAGHATR